MPTRPLIPQQICDRYQTLQDWEAAAKQASLKHPMGLPEEIATAAQNQGIPLNAPWFWIESVETNTGLIILAWVDSQGNTLNWIRSRNKKGSLLQINQRKYFDVPYSR